MKEVLYRLLDEGKTQFHVVAESERILLEYGGIQLDMAEKWNIEGGRVYYVKPYPSMLVAFSACTKEHIARLNIGLSHTDFPMLKIKTSPDMTREGYRMLNVESYGGLIQETWFDRPLSVAGKVVVSSDDPFAPEVHLCDFKKAMCVIPSLAPHLRDKSGSEKMNVQKELIPLMGLSGESESEDRLLSNVAKLLDVDEDNILDYDLYLYNMNERCVIGDKDELILSPRLDNITSVAALVSAMKNTSDENINIIALFDNEEIGSRSKQGADSVLLSQIVERILGDMNIAEGDRRRLLSQAFMMSLDVAHGTHPNYPEKSDPTNSIVLGKGVTLKSSASQRYVSDSEAAAVILALSRKYDVPVQRQVNRSGMPGGQTLGPIASSFIPVRAVDMGVPVLAMHSAAELGCLKDYEALCEMVRCVFEE